MSVFSSSRFPCPERGLILPLSFPQALSTEFRVHWRGGHARSAQTGLRWSPGPMNSFFTKSAFHISGNCQMVSYPVAPRNLCLSLPGSHGSLAARFSRVISHCQMQLLGRLAILYHWSHGEITGTKVCLSVVVPKYLQSMACRLRMGSGISQEPLSDIPLGNILRN